MQSGFFRGLVSLILNTKQVNSEIGQVVETQTENGQIVVNVSSDSLENTKAGTDALANNTTGFYNTAIGKSALANNTTGLENTAIGKSALASNTTGNFNTAIGQSALANNTTGANNTAIGQSALASNTTWQNCSGLGWNAQVTGSNQVQLGDSATTTYVYGAVQNRSDKRDKTDIKDQPLGLDFINKLRPVQFRWNLREYYKNLENEFDEESYKNETKKGKRFHNGIIAQELKEICDKENIDFAGLQHHEVNGGKDVYSIGYDEFISPLIRAVQELSEQIKNLQSEIEVLKLGLTTKPTN